MKIVVAITGASGAILGQRLLENLTEHETHLIVSEAGEKVIAYELGKGVELPATARYKADDLEAPLASSSFLVNAMVVVPCSMKTLAGIAHGYADNLILRAADNVLRMGKRLVVVPRETPLSLADIENMGRVKLAGAIVLPPVMAYYYKPRTVDEVTDFFVGKILDVLGIEHKLYKRWQGRTNRPGA
ncbi:MAG: UbiX family flavin prenyltransferase [Chloroflexota bacterium]|nr:UbiX family flavin prenyltransferase [Chloroflexota bacterium]